MTRKTGLSALLRELLAELEGEGHVPPGMVRLGGGELVSREQLNAELSKLVRPRAPEERPAITNEAVAQAEKLVAAAVGTDTWEFSVERGPDHLARRILGTSGDGRRVTIDLERDFKNGMFSGLTATTGDGRVFETKVQRGPDLTVKGFAVGPVSVH